jgi:hypothetical protein
MLSSVYIEWFPSQAICGDTVPDPRNPRGEIVEDTHVIHFLGGREADQRCKLRRKPKAVPPVQVAEVISF